VQKNRRSATRHEVSLAGQLVINGEPRPVTLTNLSLGGASVAAGGKLAMGLRVQISFLLPSAPDAIEVTATVRWSDAKATGVQFDGLRAREVWALNKYFEQLPAPS
jgi:hypothetical protein